MGNVIHRLTVGYSSWTRTEYSLPTWNPSRVIIIKTSETHLAPTFFCLHLQPKMTISSYPRPPLKCVAKYFWTGIMERDFASTNIRLSGNTIEHAFRKPGDNLHYNLHFYSVEWVIQRVFWRAPRSQVSYMLARYNFPPYRLLLIHWLSGNKLEIPARNQCNEWICNRCVTSAPEKPRYLSDHTGVPVLHHCYL